MQLKQNLLTRCCHRRNRKSATDSHGFALKEIFFLSCLFFRTCFRSLYLEIKFSVDVGYFVKNLSLTISNKNFIFGGLFIYFLKTYITGKERFHFVTKVA